MSRTLLRTQGLAVGHGERILAEGLDLELEGGELVCLIGANGVGKSTLLRALSGLSEPLRGEIFIAGETLDRLHPLARAKCLSLVLTENREPPGFTSQELVALGRHPHTGLLGLLSAEDREIIRSCMEASGCLGLAHRPFGELSDGERQRVMIARALAQEPSLILLDEPSAFLDLPGRISATRLLKRLSRERDMAVLMSTHDLDLALSHADRLWLFSPGGPLICGTPEDLVLEERFDHLFPEVGLTFDAARGTFSLAEGGRQPITFSGEGPKAPWVIHALKRLGFAPCEPGTPCALSVRVSEAGIALDSAAGSELHHSIASLQKSLSTRTPEAD
ncbi:MAG: ABC transporter ATP-binding protein [Planctomycetes bacterium]|nr:ABC transporter ATP-binding protein [Planctomycetota bacterium]